MEIITSINQPSQSQRKFPIIQESLLLNAIEHYEQSINTEMIAREVQEIWQRTLYKEPLFQALCSRCDQLAAREALGLCNRYFFHLTQYPDIASWLSPRSVGALIATHGTRAFTESKTLTELEEAVAQIRALHDLFPGSYHSTAELLFRNDIPQAKLAREIALGSTGVILFQQIAIFYSLQHRLASIETLCAVADHFEHRTPLPSTSDEIAMLITEFGMSGINECHTLAAFDQLTNAINKLLALCKESRPRTHERLQTFPATPQRNLLLNIVDGVRGPDLYTAIVIHSSDQLFTPQEWDIFGMRCLQYGRKPARLWLAIGANGTNDLLIRCAADQVCSAVDRDLPWSYRSASLLKQLVGNVKPHDPGLSATLEKMGKSAKWITSPVSLWHLANLRYPSSGQDHRPLLDIAARLRNSNPLTEQEATKLWQFTSAWGHWPQEARTEWLILHAQIASRLPGSKYAATVLHTLMRN